MALPRGPLPAYCHAVRIDRSKIGAIARSGTLYTRRLATSNTLPYPLAHRGAVIGIPAAYKNAGTNPFSRPAPSVPLWERTSVTAAGWRKRTHMRHPGTPAGGLVQSATVPTRPQSSYAAMTQHCLAPASAAPFRVSSRGPSGRTAWRSRPTASASLPPRMTTARKPYSDRQFRQAAAFRTARKCWIFWRRIPPP